MLLNRAVEAASDGAEILLEPGVHPIEHELNVNQIFRMPAFYPASRQINKSCSFQANGRDVKISGRGLRVHGPGVLISLLEGRYAEAAHPGRWWCT